MLRSNSDLATVESDVAVSPVPPSASSSGLGNVSASAIDEAPLRPAVQVAKPSAPKSAVKLNEPQDRSNISQVGLRSVLVTSQDLHRLQPEDIISFDRDSLLQLSSILLARQNSSTGSTVHAAQFSDSLPSSLGELSGDKAHLQATVDVLKVCSSWP